MLLRARARACVCVCVKVAMPEYCPMYYWLDLGLLSKHAVPTREPSFLENIRTPRAVTSSVARLRLCPRAPCASKDKDDAAGAAAGSAAGSRRLGSVRAPLLAEAHVPGAASPDEIRRAASMRRRASPARRMRSRARCARACPPLSAHVCVCAP